MMFLEGKGLLFSLLLDFHSFKRNVSAVSEGIAEDLGKDIHVPHRSSQNNSRDPFTFDVSAITRSRFHFSFQCVRLGNL